MTLGESRNPSPATDPQAIIPVERIQGPILLVACADDALWPSRAYAAAIVARLDAAHDRFPHESLVYPGAGHGVASKVPNLPAVGSKVPSRYGFMEDLGGTPATNERAIADSWAAAAAVPGRRRRLMPQAAASAWRAAPACGARLDARRRGLTSAKLI